MDLYTSVAYEISRTITLRYSSSFGLSTKLFPSVTRKHIYAVYGLVRIADEIVDTYKGVASGEILAGLEQETYKAIESGYSANPAVHAFALTARKFNIDRTLISPFFASMAMDLTPHFYTPDLYKDYIHGSAEVIGLMCLKVFCPSDPSLYARLEPGASALGSAYQKVNFLRDLASDHEELGRIYFPGLTFETFDEQAKQTIVEEIEDEFAQATAAIKQLPKGCKLAVQMSYVYYSALLKRLKKTPVSVIKAQRIRISSAHKIGLLLAVIITKGAHS